MSKKPHRCPVCGGTGHVAHDFYQPVAGYTTTSIMPVPCRSCGGSGLVWEADE